MNIQEIHYAIEQIRYAIKHKQPISTTYGGKRRIFVSSRDWHKERRMERAQLSGRR